MWIARDKDGSVHGFIVKPVRKKDKWYDNYRICDDNINWTEWNPSFTWDDEPMKVDVVWLEQLLKS